MSLDESLPLESPYALPKGRLILSGWHEPAHGPPVMGDDPLPSGTDIPNDLAEPETRLSDADPPHHCDPFLWKTVDPPGLT